MSNFTFQPPEGNGTPSTGAPDANTRAIAPSPFGANPDQPGGTLILNFGDQHITVNPAALRDPQSIAELRGRIDSATSAVIIDISSVPMLAAEDRWDTIRFLASIPRFIFRVDNQQFPSLFVATVQLIKRYGNPTIIESAVQTALETACLLFPTGAPGACTQIIEQIKSVGIQGYRVTTLVRQVHELTAGLAGDHAADGNDYVSVLDVLADALVSDDAIVPLGWELGPAGIRRVGGDGAQPTISAPVVITERLRNSATNAEFLQLAWNRGQGWEEQTMSRGVVATTRTITTLAEYGLPVTSNNAAALVQYLSDFEAVNLEVIPQAIVTNQLGWHQSGNGFGFLTGNRFLSEAAHAATADTPRSTVRFHGADEGDDQIAAGFHASGTLSGWQAAVSLLAGYPRCRLTVYVAITPPLLRILNSPNFVVSYAGPTTLGKTSNLRVGASVWGYPQEGSSTAAAIATFAATPVWIERAMAVLSDHPFILDDTKLAIGKHIATIVYAATSGRSKGRGSVAGTRRSQTCRTILMVSGEASLTSFSQDGGTRARVLEIWGSPFGEVSPELSQLIQGVGQGIQQHYGHAGPLFVEFILADRNQWPAWQQRYGELQRQYEQRAGNNGAAVRMAAHFAAITVAAELAHQAGIIPWDYVDVVSELWPLLTADTHEADRAAVALRHVMSWAAAHREEFASGGRGRTSSDHSPRGGWAGRWDRGNSYLYVGFLPHQVDEILRAGGFEPDAIRRYWRDRGWLLLTPNKQVYRTRMPDNGGVVSLVAITRAAIVEVIGSDDEAAPDPPAATCLPPRQFAAHHGNGRS